MRKKITLTLLFIGSLLSAAMPLQAKTISLDPAHIRLLLSHGEVKSGVINIDNPSEQEIRVRVYLEDWR